MSETKHLRTAVCGLGEHYFDNIAPALDASKLLTVTHVVTRDPQKYHTLSNSRRSVKRVIAIDSLGLDEIDLIIACGPPNYNHEAIQHGAAHGIPVFTEKPLPQNLNDIVRNRGRVQVGYNLSYAPLIRWVTGLIIDHGAICQASITYRTNKPREPIWDLSSIENSFLLSIACHPIHLATEVLGFARLSYSKLSTHSNFCEITAVCENDSGAACAIQTSNSSPYLEFSVEVAYSSGLRVKVDRLTEWTMSLPSRSATKGPSPSILSGKLSQFSTKSDINGFAAQFSDLGNRLSIGEPIDSRVDQHAADRTNRHLYQILSRR